jgi:hypothetical protein
MMEVPVKSLTEPAHREERPRYEAPRIQVMTEREILNTFQITQAMQTWCVAGC